ncbi:BatD family protein [Thalassotalea piscium]
MVKQLFCLLGLLIFLESQALAEVIASVDKNPVITNESFVLTITADEDVDSDALDTSPLLNDFIVGRTSVSSQTSMVNFKTSRLTKWTTVLIAKEKGRFTIPSFSIDGQKTNPISIEVLSPSNSHIDRQQDIFITNEISSKEIFVQQQLMLTVKLHFASELKRGSLTEPTLAGANIAQIGKDVETETIINGRRYRVIERTYAISPQQSGDYMIKSPLFSGEIMKPSTRRSNFLSFAETTPVSVVDDDIAITVKPIPANYQGTWLPSELIALHEEWQPAPDTFKVGDPITRVITLTAAGLSKEQLPLIEMKMPQGLKVYPDQAELHTGINDNRLVSQKVRNFAIVASKPGDYLLPEIKIPWWNTKTNRMEFATIPAKSIKIAPNPDALQNNSPDNKVMDSATQLSPTAESTTQVVIEKTPWLQWVFLTLWLLTCFAWWFSAKKTPIKKRTKANKKTTDAYQTLLSACKTNDMHAVVSLIVPWFNQLSSMHLSTLSEVTKQINQPQFEQAVTELQQACFAKSPLPWDSSQLVSLIKGINKTYTSTNKPLTTTLHLNP